MRVLHLLTALGHGGAEVWLLNLIEPLRKLGIEIEFGLKGAHLGELRGVAEQRGAPTYDIPLRPSHVGYVREVMRLSRERRYALIHDHEFVYSAVGVFAAQRMRLPSVMTLHHYTFEPQTPLTRRAGMKQLRELYGRASLRYALRRVKYVTAFSRAVMSRVVPDYETNPRCRLLRLSVDIPGEADQASRAEFRASLGWPASTPIVIHAGRFIEQKNHAGVLRVFREVERARPGAKLLLLGQGPMKEQILASARDLAERDAMKFLGLRDDVPRLLALSDVLLFPSIHEGFGLVALEANACGKPVVGTRIPGLDEAVLDRETALLSPVDDEASMAKDVLRLLDEPDLARRLGSKGRERAIALFSHDASAKLVAELYDAALSGSR